MLCIFVFISDKAQSAVVFLRRLISLQLSVMSRLSGGGGGGSSLQLSSLLTSAQSRATSLFAKAASFFAKSTPFYVTRTVDNLAEGRGGVEDETFCYLDPRVRSGSMPVPGQKHTDVIVFVIGGGCYSEFYNLQEMMKEKAAAGGNTLRNVSYGCTDMISGGEFISQLERLGSPSSSTTS